MKKVVTIQDLTIINKDKKLLDSVSLNFYSGVSTFLCGTCGSGKTLLLKALANEVKYEGEIHYFGKFVVLFDQSTFSTNSVEDEIHYFSLNTSQKEFVSLFFDDSLLKENPKNLSDKKQKLLILCSCLWQKPAIVFIDNLYAFLSEYEIKKFNAFFKKLHITVVLVSTDIEQALHYNYMIVLDEGKVAVEGKTEQVLLEEKILKRLGIGLPFYVDLSLQLKCYNLVDKVYLNKEDLVKKLWNSIH